MPVTRQQSRRKEKQEDASKDNDADVAEDEAKKKPPSKTLTPGESASQDVEVYNVLAVDGKEIHCERRGLGGLNNIKPPARFVYTHGAGGDLQTPAAKNFAEGFAKMTTIVSFKGSMNFQSRVKWFHAVAGREPLGTPLGGRSMGARAAVVAALESSRKVRALVLVSYPLQVGAKNDDERKQVLLNLPEDLVVLFIIGSKDSTCPLDDLQKVRTKMKANSWLIEVAGADHGMTLSPKTAGELMRRKTGELAARWLHEIPYGLQYRHVEWDRETESVAVSDWKNDSDVGEPLKKKRRMEGP